MSLKIACSLILLAAMAAVSCGSKKPATPATPAAPASAPAPEATPVPPVAVAPADPIARAKPVMDVLAMLAKHQQSGRGTAEKVGFELPESAINDYLAYSLRTKPRPGIGALHVSLFPDNQISVEAEIDFDSIQLWNSGTIPDILRSLLKGKQTVRMNLEFSVQNAQVTVKWKDAQGPGAAMLNSGIAVLMRAIGMHQPEAYDPSKPMPLPYGLKRVWTEKQLAGGET